MSARNAGVPLDLGWVEETHANEPEIHARARPWTVTVSDPLRIEDRSVDEWLLRCLRCLDLTTLSPDDTPERVRRLCAAARAPLPSRIARGFAGTGKSVRVAAVCVFDRFVGEAVEALHGSGIPVAAVTAGFPRPLEKLSLRVRDIEAAVRSGADEVDVVITRSHVHRGAWEALYDEVRALREAAAASRIKTILGTGELSVEEIARASLVSMMAGADFVKTSTGLEAVNASFPAGVAMASAIRSYLERTGFAVGLKPAGGIRTARQAVSWLRLSETELGPEWTGPELFRIGASSLLEDLRRTLETRLGEEA